MLIKKNVEGDITKNYYESSNLMVSEYNKMTKDLLITFKYGGKYKYDNVSLKDYTRFELADSQGKVLNSHIKPNYSFENMGMMDVKLIKEELANITKEILMGHQDSIISAMKVMVENWENGEVFNDPKLDKITDLIKLYKENSK